MKNRLLKVAIALSIANLCFLFIWGRLLALVSNKGFSYYFLQRPPEQSLIWALVVDIAILGLIVFGLLLLRNNKSRPLRTVATILLGAISLFGIYQISRVSDGWLIGVIGWSSILALHLAVAAVIVFLVVRSPKRVLPRARGFFLVLSPLFFVLLGQGLWLYCGPNSHYFTRGHAAGPLPSTASHARVIWIIFDEMDYRLAFTARPARIQLPHFDALRRTSIFGEHVKSPSHDTLSATLSLVLAKDIPQDGAVDTGSRPVRLLFSGCSRYVSIRSQRNIFQRVRKLGYNTAVAGWYQPYCRLFGSSLSTCTTTLGLWGVEGFHNYLRPRTLWGKAIYLAEWQGTQVPLKSLIHWNTSMPETPFMSRRIHIATMQLLLKDSARILRNPNLNFVYLHFPVPHPPGIWDTKAQRFTASDPSDYIDNLVLADRTLGKIREILEQTGDWDRSTILVSADHPFRPKNWLYNPHSPTEMIQDTHRIWQPYIPFFLKLPGQKTGIEYHREFNSILSANLLLAALQGQIRTPAQAVQWLNAHAAASEEKVCR
ncbi:MAG: sulfatase-like hydrolase/transferase [Terriglobia bacterium]